MQLLNKARASKFSVTLATQCVDDLATRTGSQEAASRIIANCNNLISLRVNDLQSAKVIASVLPETVVNERSSSQSFNEGIALNDSYATSRSVFQRSSELFPPSMLTQLPDFEFIARFANGAFYKGCIPLLQAPLQTTQPAAVYEVRGANSTTTQKAKAQERAKAIADASTASASDIDDIFAQSQLVDIGFQPCGLRSQRPAASAVSAAATIASADADAAAQGSASDGSSINPHTGLKDEEIAQLEQLALYYRGDNQSIAELCQSFGLDPSFPALRGGLERPTSSSDLKGQAELRRGSYVGERSFYKGAIDPTIYLKGPVFTGDEDAFLLHKFSDQDYHPDHEPSSWHISPMALGAILQSCNRLDRAYVEAHPEAAPATSPLIWAAALKCSQKAKAKAKKPSSSEPRQSNALSVGATGTAKADTAVAGSAPASQDGTAVGGKYRLWAKVCSGVKSLFRRGHTLLCRVGLMVLRALIQVFLSIPALVFYRRLYACSLLLCMTVLLSCIFNGFAAFELFSHSVSYTFSYIEALLGALFSGMWQLDTTIAVNRSFFTRFDLVLDVYLDLWPLSLSCLMMGLMRGHQFNLIAEMSHSSLMGIKKFTSFTGWPVIILLILALIMLGSAFVLFLEGSLLIAWILIFNLGFSTACFYTQHTK